MIYEVRFTTVVEIAVTVDSHNEEAAEEAAAKAATDLLNASVPGSARIYGSIDGIPADSVEEVQA